MSKELVDLQGLAVRINEQQARIEQAWGMTLELAREAGELLREAKRAVGHGNWLPWLEANCRVSASMAGKYMKIAKGWPELVAENTEHVPNLSIRDAMKLLAKPREPKVGMPEVVDADFTEVVSAGSPEPSAPLADPITLLMDQLEAEFLRSPFRGRDVLVEGAIDRLSNFQHRHCSFLTTLTELRESFPGVAHRDLREELVGFIGQWQYARIQRNDKGQECVRTEWAEEFVRLQRERGWQVGRPLVSWMSLIMSSSATPKNASLPRL